MEIAFQSIRKRLELAGVEDDVEFTKAGKKSKI
jgi:hypothetical protein